MFNSLGRCVTIGRLTKRVIDASLVKQKSPVNLTLSLQPDESGIQKEEEEEERLAMLFDLFSAFVQPQVLDEACIYELTGLTISGNEMAGWIRGYPSGFFIGLKQRIVYDFKD